MLFSFFFEILAKALQVSIFVRCQMLSEKPSKFHKSGQMTVDNDSELNQGVGCGILTVKPKSLSVVK